MQRTKVLITGATSGIGFESALLCAEKGYEVIATGRTHAKLEPLRVKAESKGLMLKTAIVDVSDPKSVMRLHEEVLQMTNGYGLDVLVNNAGYAEGGAIEEIPLDSLRKQFDTNVFGLVAMTQSFLKEMRQRRSGKIINVSSVVGRLTIPLMGAYCASKYAVESLSDALRMELAQCGIHVVLIEPGSVQTNFGESVSGTLTWVNESSPYTSHYEKMKKDRKTGRGAHPFIIAKTVVKVIETNRPKARYAVPSDSKLMPVVKLLLPTRFMDTIIRKVIMG